MASSSLLCLLASCLLFAGYSTAAVTNVRETLITALRARASPAAPPPDASLPVNVKVELKLVGVDSLCPKTYRLNARAYEIYTWNDSRLAWSQSEFNASYVILSATDIWAPDLTIWQNTDDHNMRDKDHRALVLPSGEVRLKYGSQPKIACNETAWDMHLQSSGSGSKPGKLPATYKCSFDMSSDSGTDMVVFPPVESKPSGDAGDGSQQSKTASLDWFKPNAIYDVTSFEAKRRERPLHIGPALKLKLAVIRFDVLVKQMQPLRHTMDGSEGSSMGSGRRQGGRGPQSNRRGSNTNANEEQDEEDQDMTD